MTGIAVRAEHLVHEYAADGEQVRALDDVSFAVAASGRLTVVGPSGSGKSTLLAVLAGLHRPTSGSVRIGEHEVTALDARGLLALRSGPLSVVVQDPKRNLLPYATATDNVRFAQRPAARGLRTRDPAQLLTALGLGALMDARVDRLSGGERQRVSIAVGLALEPGVLLVDEPTSALDARARDDVLRLLETATASTGTTLVTITHDPLVAERLGGVLALDAGRVATA